MRGASALFPHSALELVEHSRSVKSHGVTEVYLARATLMLEAIRTRAGGPGLRCQWRHSRACAAARARMILSN